MPIPSNTTCHIYRNGDAPPDPPAASGVKIFLREDFEAAAEAMEGGSAVGYNWTHLALMPATTDIRDGFAGGGGSPESTADSIHVPDDTGTEFLVIFVERHGRGTASDHKKVYLNRAAPTWPSNEV
jgi:hypothetical protein